MSLKQYLRIVWARKWLALALLVLVAGAGIAYTLYQPKQYTAQSSLVLEVRIDPALGAIAPALAAPSYMATQVEVLKSDRVAARVVKMLGVERSPSAVAQWREETKGKIPLDRYFAGVLHKGLSVDPSPGSNVLNVYFTARDPIFAQAAANAFAQAYMDTSVELRVAPARQSAAFLEEQTSDLRKKLEEAQARLTKFQQEKGIVVTNEQLDQENARYNALIAQYAAAQGEGVEAATRQRNSGSVTSPDVFTSPGVQSLKAQIAAAETKLIEVSAFLGKNHPTRLQLEAQIAELKKQLATEVKRVASSTSTVSRSSDERIATLKKMMDAQKQNLLSLRADHDQIALLRRDVEAAQRAYDAVIQRVGTLNLESQNNQANTRLLSPAVEPLEPSNLKLGKGILLSIIAGLVVAIGAALGLELLDRRVRDPEDLLVTPGVPVIGVLRPASSKRPIYRRLLALNPSPGGPLLSAPGAQS